jgi:hypothetical protein
LPWLTALAIAALQLGTVVRANQSACADTIPADTYADPGAHRLIERARAARGSEAEGLDGYEVLLHERLYVGLGVARVRRERVHIYLDGLLLETPRTFRNRQGPAPAAAYRLWPAGPRIQILLRWSVGHARPPHAAALRERSR